MQKVFNVLTTVSFVGVVAIIGSGAYVYSQREVIADRVKARIMEGVAEVVEDSIVSGFDVPAPAVPSSPAGNGIPVPF